MAEKVKSRGLTRRLAQVVLSLATLLGGGWGVYHYAHSTDTRATDTRAINARAVEPATTQSSAAADELKQLFANESTTKAKTAQANKPTPIADRYGVTATSSIREFPPENPFASAPSIAESKVVESQTEPKAEPVNAALATNRYANGHIPSAKSIPAEPQLEVTRGQGGGEQNGQNPLRASVDSLAATPSGLSPSDDQARAAFRDARPLQSVGTPNNRYGAGPSGSEKTGLGLADLDSAAPLRKPVSTLDINREGQQRSVLTNPPQKTARLTPRSFGAKPLPSNNHLSSNIIGSSVGTSPAANALPRNNHLSGNITPTPGLTSTLGTGRPGERLLEGVQSPSITIQKLAPQEIQVGKKCTFAIRVQNTGQRTAQNVQIRDEVPMGTQLLGTVPRASVSGSEILWDLGTLSVGEERTVEVELIPTDEGELGSVATVLFSAQASAKARCTRPELALRLSASKPQVLVGQQQLVQVEVSNPGSGDATGVMLLESVPSGVSHAAGPALELAIGTLRAGESRRLELVLNAEQAGQIENRMTARADANLQVDASCQFEVIAPRLQVSVEGPKRRYLERPATYQVSVQNPGTATAKEVKLVTHLPKGLQFVKANNMGEYDAATHSIHWSLAELPASEQGAVELVALPIEAGEQTLQIAVQADRGLEDRIEKRVMIEGLVAIMFEVVDVEDPIEIGGDTTYEIRVLNQGSKPATNVQVTAIMPPAIRAVSAQGETRHKIQGERVLFAPLPQLAPKADTTYRIHAQGLRPGDQRVRVQVTTDDLEQPITKEESTRVYSDQ